MKTFAEYVEYGGYDEVIPEDFNFEGVKWEVADGVLTIDGVFDDNKSIFGWEAPWRDYDYSELVIKSQISSLWKSLRTDVFQYDLKLKK